MVDENYYIKLIDFGEAKIVDNYEEESKYSSQGNSEYGGRHGSKSGSSDGKSSYFGRMLRSGNKRNGIPKAGTFVGTPLYAAPEMLESNQSGLYTDLWALGCIIYEMACGNKMFRGKNNQEVFNKILDQDYEFPSSMDKDAVDLIQKLVQIEPMMRLGLKNTQVLKNHPFFKGINFENLQAQTLQCPPLDISICTTDEAPKSIVADPEPIIHRTQSEIFKEAKILEIQEKFKVKVVKAGLVKKQKGILFK